LRRGLAEVAEKYLHKGDKVFIEGRIKTRSWEDDRGERKYATEIHADNMTMLGGARRAEDENSGSTYSNSSGSAQPADLAREDDEDDLPF